MTNAKKFLRDGVSVEEIAEQIAIAYFDRQSGGIQKAVKTFFESTTTPTLTEDERVILRNIKSYDTIGRTESGYLITRDRHTIPMEDEEYAYNSMYGFNHLFQFIKERRRIRDS